MEYTERVKEKYSSEMDSINKIENEDMRTHLKLKLMGNILNEYSNMNTQ